jgi:hypothetical protein
VIKAQAGKTHNTVACFLIDFSCLMSITKGLKSLEKHVTRKEDKARWGFFVQKETSDLSRDNSDVRIETIWGAAFVYASKTDLPWNLFDYKVMPPHLPYGAFRHAHMWGRPLRQWAVMSAHRHLCDAVELEGRNLAQLQSPQVQKAFNSYDITAVVPSQGESGAVLMRRANANKDVAKLSGKIERVFNRLASLSGDDYTALVDEISHDQGRLRDLTEDCKGLFFDRDGGEVGWCTGPTFLDEPIDEPIDAATALVALRASVDPEINDGDGGVVEANAEINDGDSGDVDSEINDGDGGGGNVDSEINDGDAGVVEANVVEANVVESEDNDESREAERGSHKRVKRAYVKRNHSSEAERRAHKHAYDMVLERKQKKADAQRERRRKAKLMKGT